MSQLIRSLDRHACDRPDTLAIRDIDDAGDERVLTWRQLRDDALLHANRLRRSQEDRTDRTATVVLVSAPNRIETMAAILGGLWADAAVIPVSPELQPAELLDVARRASVTTVVGAPPVLETLSGLVVERIPLDSLALAARAAADPRLRRGAGARSSCRAPAPPGRRRSSGAARRPWTPSVKATPRRGRHPRERRHVALHSAVPLVWNRPGCAGRDHRRLQRGAARSLPSAARAVGGRRARDHPPAGRAVDVRRAVANGRGRRRRTLCGARSRRAARFRAASSTSSIGSSA